MVARAGSHVEHDVVVVQLEQIAHARDERRLGDRLSAADRQRPVGVREGLQGGGDEQFARDLGDGGDHALVEAAPAQALEQLIALVHRSRPLPAPSSTGSIRPSRSPTIRAVAPQITACSLMS